MRDPSPFIRSCDRPLPATAVWLGAAALCVEGEVDWSTIGFQCVACEDPGQVGFAVCELQALRGSAALSPDLPVHSDGGSAPPKDFTGLAFLGAWSLAELRGVRIRAAKAEADASRSEPGLIESAVAAIKGPSSAWLAMSSQGGAGVDQVLRARDGAHAARLALALPGTLRGLLPLDELAGWCRRLEAGALADPHSEGALLFRHRSAEESAIESREFMASNPKSESSQAILTALEQGLPLSPIAKE